MARDRDDLEPMTRGLAKPQEDAAGLVLWFEAHQDDGRRVLQVGKCDVQRGCHDPRGEELRLLPGVGPRTEVDVVRTQDGAGELAVGEGILGSQPAAGQHPDLALGPGQSRSGRGHGGGP